MDNLTLFGVSLTLLIVAGVKAAQDEIGFSDKLARWVRGLLGAGAFVLVAYAPDVQAAWPEFERVVTIFGGALGVLFSVLGYWPEAQKLYGRALGR
jgi:hypothetical protein